MKEIFERTSIRSYRAGRIADETVEKLLQAAMRAPSARNQQPWEFVVIRKRETMSEITGFHPYATALLEADLAIAVCGNTDYCIKKDEFWIQDCSAATQNILLEAQHLGIGAVWLGIYPNTQRAKDLQNLLALPEQVIPLNVIALGYPKAPAVPKETFQPGRIHYERW